MHKRLLLLLLPAIALVGCGKKDVSSIKEISDLSQLSEYENVTPADSMMFYFGQMQAANYWQDAETDTLLRSQEERNQFMEGFRAAMKMDSDDSAYNKGLQLGLRLSLRLREFSARYHTDFSEEVLIASLAHFLNADEREGLQSAQQGFYNIKDRLEMQAADRDVESAKGNLVTKANEMGFTMLSDTLYSLEITPGFGPLFKMGDRLAVEVTACTLDGNEIVARQFPDSVTIGEGRVPAVVRAAILTMNNGSTYQFMTTPRTLFGKRYTNYHLSPNEPVIFTVKAGQN